MAYKKSKYKVINAEGAVQKGATVTVASSISTLNADINPEIEKPILEITVSNPFKKLLYWLNQIRKRQTTTLAFKLSVPLIALPVLVFAVFEVGRYSGMAFLKSQATPTPMATAAPTPQLPVEISRAGTLKIAKGSTGTRYLLSLRNGTIVSLMIPDSIDLEKYANKQVLVTGYLDKDTGIINVGDIAEITVYNTTEIHQPSPTAAPATATPSPEATASAN